MLPVRLKRQSQTAIHNLSVVFYTSQKRTSMKFINFSDFYSNTTISFVCQELLYCTYRNQINIPLYTCMKTTEMTMSVVLT